MLDEKTYGYLMKRYSWLDTDMSMNSGHYKCSADMVLKAIFYKIEAAYLRSFLSDEASTVAELEKKGYFRLPDLTPEDFLPYYEDDDDENDEDDEDYYEDNSQKS